MNYFFESLYKDYGADQLTHSLSALLQHIEYYEEKQNTTMFEMRSIHKKYSDAVKKLSLIINLDQLIQNISKVEYYLTEGSDEQRLAASLLIKRGTCFVAYKVGDELRFAPSRFLGYSHNNLIAHSTSRVDGRDTNKTINLILKSNPLPNNNLEKKYIGYCTKLGIKPQLKGGAYGVSRKYWQLTLQDGDLRDNKFTEEFPEGKIVERMHLSRERNFKVVELAKRNFKEQYGKLFCQVCGFDFEAIYGIVGKNFIEGHHTIAVSEMSPGHKTKSNEIAMLCGNCHRMVHKKRPWLTIEQLGNLLKK
jgi:5-methylcytosine-specific restriction protein A